MHVISFLSIQKLIHLVNVTLFSPTYKQQSWAGPGNKAVVVLILCIKAGHEPFSKM